MSAACLHARGGNLDPAVPVCTAATSSVLVLMSCLRFTFTIKSINPVSSPSQSGKFGGASSEAQENQPQGTQTAAEAAEHENMKAVLRSGPREGESGTSTVPGLRTRTRAGSARGPPPY